MPFLQPQLYQEVTNDVILQGDIFPEVNFYIGDRIPNNEPVLSSSPLYVGKKMFAVISSTCDIPKSKYLLVSPVYSLNDFFLAESQVDQARAASRVHLIKERKKFLEKFYLQDLPVTQDTIEDYIIDLKVINTFNTQSLNNIPKIASLSDWGRHLLNYQLNWLLGRPIVDWSNNK